MWDDFFKFPPLGWKFSPREFLSCHIYALEFSCTSCREEKLVREGGSVESCSPGKKSCWLIAPDTYPSPSTRKITSHTNFHHIFPHEFSCPPLCWELPRLTEKSISALHGRLSHTHLASAALLAQSSWGSGFWMRWLWPTVRHTQSVDTDVGCLLS